MEQKAIFEDLYRKYQGMVKQLCLGFSKGEEAAANDLSQDVFMNVWNALSDFRFKSSYKTWIYRITINTCLMQIRKDKKMTVLSVTDDHLSLKREEEAAQRHKDLYLAIGQLAKVDRLLMMLLLDELSYEEIGEVMGIKQTNLRVKIHRVKVKLKKILNNG